MQSLDGLRQADTSRLRLFLSPIHEAAFTHAAEVYASSCSQWESYRVLRTFYASCQPKDIGDVLHLEPPYSSRAANVSPIRWGAHSESALAPWTDQALTMPLPSRLQRLLVGGMFPKFTNHNLIGPKTSRQTIRESRRLTNLVDSIRAHGYLSSPEPDESIVVTEFVLGEESLAFQVQSGVHRASVLAALGWRHIPVIVGRVVDSRDAPRWPKVVSGKYSVEDAEKFFRLVVSGSHCNS